MFFTTVEKEPQKVSKSSQSLSGFFAILRDYVGVSLSGRVCSGCCVSCRASGWSLDVRSHILYILSDLVPRVSTCACVCTRVRERKRP